MSVIDSLLVGLGFEIDNSKLDEFHKKIGETKKLMLEMGAVATGAAVGIGLLVGKVAEGMGEIHSFAELNELTSRQVAALGKIAVENDGSFEGMKSTIQSLNKVIGEASLGIGRGAMTFEKLKLSAKNADGSVKSFDQILDDVADKMVGLSRQEQIAMAEKLGIDPQFVKVLEKGSAELGRLREEAEAFNPFTNEQYRLADQVDKLFIKAKSTLGVFTKQIAVGLMPVVRDALKAYLEWFKAARKATDGVFAKAMEAFTSVVARLFTWLMRLVTALTSVASWVAHNRAAAILAAAAFAAFLSIKTYNATLLIASGLEKIFLNLLKVNATAMVIPAIIGAVILAIGLLIDDWMAFKEGGDSVIGELVKQFPELLDVINAIEGAVKSVGDFFVEQWNALGPEVMELGVAIFGLVKVLAQVLWPVVKQIFTGWGYLLAFLLPYVIKTLALIIEGWTSLIGWLIEGAKMVVEGWTLIFGALGDLFDWIGSSWADMVAGILDSATAVFGALTAAGEWLGGNLFEIFAAISDAWDGVTGGIKSAFSGAIDWVLGLVDQAKKQVLGFLDSVTGTISKVAGMLGLSATVAIAAAPSMQPPAAQIAGDSQGQTRSAPAGSAAQLMAQQANAGPLETPGGIIGKAGDISNQQTSTTTTTQQTQITAPITVYSSDPERAGESVRKELDRVNKTATRNGESAVKL